MEGFRVRLSFAFIALRSFFRGQKFFSGGIFLRPKEIAHEPSAMFYKNEVIAVEQVDSVESFKNVQGRCAVLTVKQYETRMCIFV